MAYDAIILASGQGTRTGLGYNKMLYTIKQERLIDKVCQPFLLDDDCSRLIIVSSDLTSHDFTHPKIKVVAGGKWREESALLGLQHVQSSVVLIHDGARCYITSALIQRVYQNISLAHPSVVPYIEEEIEDGSFKVDGKIIQTPQGFIKDVIQSAMQKACLEKRLADFRDDASIVEHYQNIAPYFIKGESTNIKVTTKQDLLDLEINEGK